MQTSNRYELHGAALCELLEHLPESGHAANGVTLLITMELLDPGRKRRLHDGSQRMALAVVHESCAIAGCQRPFAWCEIHHCPLSWLAGGPTDLENALPLCGHHHRRAHDGRYDLRRHPTGEWRFHSRR